jgi:hypothetical protein
MLGGVKMLGCVLVLGRIAAAYMATRETKPQVYPAISHLEAFLATLGLGFDVVNLI